MNANGSLNIVDLLVATSLYVNIQHYNKMDEDQKRSEKSQKELVSLFTDMNDKLSKIISLLEENK